LIQLPFVFVLAWIVTKVIPGNDVNEQFRPRILDKNLIDRAPSFALQEAQDEIQSLGKMALSILESVNYEDEKSKKHVEEKHQVIENMYDNIRQYLTKISEKKLSANDAERMSVLFDVNSAVLKVAGLSQSYMADLETQTKGKVHISEKALKSINQLYEHVTVSFRDTVEIINVYDDIKKDEIVKRSQEAYGLEHDLRKEHIKRLSTGECTPEGAIRYLDMISILERIGYHSRIISESMINYSEDISSDKS
ncbi:PhoU domain-containing protein, partial [Staphylococcus arlettae]